MTAKTAKKRATPPSTATAAETTTAAPAPADPPIPWAEILRGGRTTARPVSIRPQMTSVHQQAEMRKLGGRYRITHGWWMIPIAREARLLPNGLEDDRLPKQFKVGPGSVVELNDLDAMNGLDQGTLEPLDVADSRVGQCWLGDEARRGNGKFAPTTDYNLVARLKAGEQPTAPKPLPARAPTAPAVHKFAKPGWVAR